jgi:hypothetical protein
MDPGPPDPGSGGTGLENIGSRSWFSSGSREKYFEICKKIVCICDKMGIQ